MRTYRLSESAEEDIVAILAHTESRFGAAARLRYQTLLIVAFRNIAEDPDRPGSVSRPELGAAVRSYHLSHGRDRARVADNFVRRPRHILLYRVVNPQIVGIGRILHDAMEMSRHVPSRFGDE